MKIVRPAAGDAAELDALAKVAARTPAEVAARRQLFGLVCELPNGAQLITHYGPSIEVARDRIGYWLGRNPEAKFDLSRVRPMTPAEAQEVAYDILKRYPRRKTLAELGGGRWTNCMTQPWRVPGSRIKNPNAPARPVSGWGGLAKW